MSWLTACVFSYDTTPGSFSGYCTTESWTDGPDQLQPFFVIPYHPSGGGGGGGDGLSANDGPSYTPRLYAVLALSYTMVRLPPWTYLEQFRVKALSSRPLKQLEGLLARV